MTDPRATQLTRNWDELLQEIRVTQTGVQILTGFLLTVPFSARFDELTQTQRWAFLAVLGGSILTTGLVVAPVAFHRMLFRQRRRELLVDVGDRCARLGLVTLAVTVAGVAGLVADLTVAGNAGLLAFAAVLVGLTLLWGVAPRWADRHDARPRLAPPESDDDVNHTTHERRLS